MSKTVGRDSSVGIATRYELDGPGIESRWGANFPAPVQTGPGAYAASCTMDAGPFPGIKLPERGVEHAPVYSAKVKKRVELYLHFPSGTSWRILRVTFLLYIGKV